MTNTFFISDHHFSHGNIALKFTKEDGTPARVDPRTGQRFESVHAMNDYMVKQWNSVVTAKDRVYVLGDFSMTRQGLQVLHYLAGRIYVVLGNHDPWKKKDWDQFPNVDQLAGVRMFPALGWVCTHIPVHERQLQGRWTHNIHGHLHTNRVMLDKNRIDKRYFNVSVEQINYTPIEIEELKKRLND